MNKANIISLFGKQAGNKLLGWLDPCCDKFCTDVRDCVGTFSLPITTTLNNGIVATYDQSNNFLVPGLPGAGQIWNQNGSEANILASIDTSSSGGTPNTTIVGYISLGSGAASNSSFNYNSITDISNAALKARNLTGNECDILLKANNTSSNIRFVFNNTQSYLFPSTSPSPGTVLGYSAANTLDWVTTTSSISIGDPINSGTASRILFEDSSNKLAESSSLIYNETTGVFQVTNLLGSLLFNIDPVMNQYGIGDLVAVNNKTSITVDDSLAQILLVSDNKIRGQASNSDIFLDLDKTNLLYQIGDVSAADNGTRIRIDDLNQTIRSYIAGEYIVQDTSNNRYFSVFPTGRIVQIGDYASNFNGTYVSVDDINQLVRISNVPDYADDAAAILGGLNSGHLYKTTTGGSTFLKIVP